MGHTADIKNLLQDFATFKPTFILSVPRVFEKIYNSAEQKATAEGKGKIFATAAETAIAWSTAKDEGGAGVGLRAKHGLFDKLVYGKLRAAMGGQVLYAVSGGAPLGSRLGHFFRGIGVTVLEGTVSPRRRPPRRSTPRSRSRSARSGLPFLALVSASRGRRDPDPRQQRLRGLPQQRRGDLRLTSGRLVPHRRHR